jgi:hypothetical protein
VTPGVNRLRTVFLSFSRADSDYAERLTKALKAKGVTVLTGFQAPPGADVASAILTAVQNADAFVVLVSRTSSGSSWMNAELGAALAEHLSDPSRPIIPVLLDKDADIPALLARYQVIDARSDTTPEAVADRILEAISATPAFQRESPEKPQTLLDFERAMLRSEEMAYELERINRYAWISRLFLVTSSVLVVVLGVAGVLLVPNAATATWPLVAVSLLAAAATAAIGYYFGVTTVRRR